MNDTLDVTRYHSVNLFLKDYMSYRVSFDAKFSYAVLAKELNFKSRVYLRLVVLGERPLQEQLIPEFIRVIGLKGSKAEFFKNLVHFSQAKTSEEKRVFGLKLITLTNQNNENTEAQEHFEFLALAEHELEDYHRDLQGFIQEQQRKRSQENIENRRMYQLSFALAPVSKK